MKRLLFVLCMLPLGVFADGLPTQPYIYVQADGEIQRAADQVTLSFSIGFRDRDEAAANKKTQAQASKVFALLNGEKIAEKDVVAESISSHAEYAENKDDSASASDGSELVRQKFGKIIGYPVVVPFGRSAAPAGATEFSPRRKPWEGDHPVPAPAGAQEFSPRRQPWEGDHPVPAPAGA